MEISYLGHSSFRLKGKNVSLVTDPYSPEIGFKFPKIEADIITISHDHQDHNQKDLVGGNPYVIAGPGEYEVKEVSIYGLQTFHDETQGTKRGKNTVYRIELEDLSFGHLGDLGHSLSAAQLSELNGVDILFIPVGGVYTIGPKTAVEVVNQIEPMMVIPMHYFVKGLDEKVFAGMAGVEDFLKEMGAKVVPQPKLIISREKLPTELEVIVLERRQ